MITKIQHPVFLTVEIHYGSLGKNPLNTIVLNTSVNKSTFREAKRIPRMEYLKKLMGQSKEIKQNEKGPKKL